MTDLERRLTERLERRDTEIERLRLHERALGCFFVLSDENTWLYNRHEAESMARKILSVIDTVGESDG